MGRLRYTTAGESHGPGLTAIVEGVPAGLEVDEARIELFMRRRQRGYGAGGRMKIERDRAEIRSGVRHGLTTGAPIALWIENRDFANWEKAMSAGPPEEGADTKAFTKVVPGHADFAGALKYGHHDLRNVLERASARETAARAAVGAVALAFLERFGITIRSRVVSIGPERDERPEPGGPAETGGVDWDKAEQSDVRTDDDALAQRFRNRIDRAKKERTTVGGVVQTVAYGAPVGLGSHIQWDRKLDARIAQAMISINAAKGVAIGDGFANTARWGREVQDVLEHAPRDPRRFRKTTNHAGGIEGGMSNGNPITVLVAIKAIATMTSPLPSVDINTGESVPAQYNRSDICQVPRACPIAEAMLAITLADAMLEKLGGDSMSETLRNHAGYVASHQEFGTGAV